MMMGSSTADGASQAIQGTHGAGGTVQATFHIEFACVQCADDIMHALVASPHVATVHVDYPGRRAQVTYHAGMITTGEIQAMISGAAHGCRCVTDMGASDMAEPEKPSGGDLAALAHGADMAVLTQGTAADRMQYEFPHTGGARLHDVAHRGPATGTAPPSMEHGGHGDHTMDGGHEAMGHDMSDPQMARAMEHDMRTRFFGALALAVPTVLFSPLAMTTFGLHLVPQSTANWLIFPSPRRWCGGQDGPSSAVPPPPYAIAR